MKKIFFLTLIFLIFANVAHAAPFLVCDPQAGVTHYKFQNSPAWVPTTHPAQPDGSLRMDVASASVGTTNIEVAACRGDDVWGELCSPFVSFSFVRPSAPASPAGWRLQPTLTGR